ncbi:MAG: hypothetical protein Q8O89_04010 [Nanoarchaeota archaeon]|nr:hypothetical protein [Nanoarchaeota archaeon]
MYKESKQNEIFAKCCSDGIIEPIHEIEIDLIETSLKISEGDLESVNLLKKGLEINSNGWSSIYKLHYDALRELIDSFLRFDLVKSSNHKCLFAYLCEKHPELELDWNFFEKIRTKRNGINYRGEIATYEDWKAIELQANLYINTLKKEIEKKLKKNKE